jgi:hypothetical protein
MVHILICSIAYNNLHVMTNTVCSTDKVQDQCGIVSGGFHYLPVMLCGPHYIHLLIS